MSYIDLKSGYPGANPGEAQVSSSKSRTPKNTHISIRYSKKRSLMLLKKLALITTFLFSSSQACQGYRYVKIPAKLRTHAEVNEYQTLLHSCRMIKQNMKAIGDHRLLIEDAVETSITLYLKGMDGEPAKVLLEDLQRNGFSL